MVLLKTVALFAGCGGLDLEFLELLAVPVKLAEAIAKNLKECIETGTYLEKEIAIAN